ncbi:hypothetical protein EIP91_002740 [Steccherinum ochraceum]|uniref:RING-type domain-containing protein n=1 Tax=Steccherinum ochraceum TaxID=92696 RepID=A0A4R0RE36_9APHY|nr:hypothetical protein EIP91_002740 [Steccherinum ochraceum]
MDTPDSIHHRPGSYKRSFDDMDSGEAGPSSLGVALLVAGGATAHHDRSKRARSENRSPSLSTEPSTHIPLDSNSRTEPSQTVSLHSTPEHVHHAASIPLEGLEGTPPSHGSDEEALVDVEVSLELSADSQDFPQSSAFQSAALLSPHEPSAHVSTSTSGDLTPSSDEDDSIFDGLPPPPPLLPPMLAPLQVPSSPRLSEPLNDANIEDRFRLSMERFSTFDGLLSVFRDPEPPLNASSSHTARQSEAGASHSQFNPDEDPWLTHAPFVITSPMLSGRSSPPRAHAPSPHAAEHNRGVGQTAPLNYSERLNRLLEDGPRSGDFPRSMPTPPALRRALDAAAPPAFDPSTSRFVLPDHTRHPWIERRTLSSVESPWTRTQNRAPSHWELSVDSSNPRPSNDVSQHSRGIPTNSAEAVERGVMYQRARYLARARALAADRARSRPVQSYNDPPSLDFSFIDPYLREPTGLERHRSPLPLYAGRREAEDTATGVSARSSHRRTPSEADEAEAAWLFNEMEDRYQAANNDSLSSAPLRPRSPPSIHLGGPTFPPPSTSTNPGTNRNFSSITWSADTVRRQLPRIAQLDEPEDDFWDVLRTLRGSSGTAATAPPPRDPLPPVPQRQHAMQLFPDPPGYTWYNGELRPRGSTSDMYPPPPIAHPVAPPTLSISPNQPYAFMPQPDGTTRLVQNPARAWTDEVLNMFGGIDSAVGRATERSEDTEDINRRLEGRLRASSAQAQLSNVSMFGEPRNYADEVEVEELLSSARHSLRSTRPFRATSTTGSNSSRGTSSNRRPLPLNWDLPGSDEEEDALVGSRSRRSSTYLSRPNLSAAPRIPAVSAPLSRAPSSRLPHFPTPNYMRGLSSSVEAHTRTSGLQHLASLHRHAPDTATTRARTDVAASASGVRQSERTARNPSNSINLEGYHDGPFRASLARSERLRRERDEVRQRVAARQERDALAREPPRAASSDAGITRSQSRSSRGRTEDLNDRVQRLQQASRIGQTRRDDHRDIHDSVTRQLRSHAARVAAEPNVWTQAELPSILPNAAANETRQRQLIENYRAQRSSSAHSAGRSGWGDIDESDSLPWRHGRPRHSSTTQTHLADEWFPSGLRGPGARRAMFFSSRRRTDRDQGGSHVRSFGDYIRDEDLDTSYEGLLRLTSLIGEARPRGTSRTVIDSLPNGKYSEWATASSEKRCPICLDDYEPSDPVLKVPKCSHWFHKDCLEQWLGSASTCPVCRGPIDPNAPHIEALPPRFSRFRDRRRAVSGRTQPLGSRLAPPAAPVNADPVPGPSNANAAAAGDDDVEMLDESDLFDDQERDLLFRSLQFLTRRGRDA